MEIALVGWSLALTILLGVGIVWVLDLQGRLTRLESRVEGLSGTGDDGDGTTVLGPLAGRLSRVNARTERLAGRAQGIERTLLHSVQGIGVVRYNAFEDTGGDQSFSLALIDGRGDGVVMSALYGRDATRVYAKPVENWRSSRSLAQEEEEALLRARRIVVPDLD